VEHVGYDIEGGDYREAGAASRAIKAHLKAIGARFRRHPPRHDRRLRGRDERRDPRPPRAPRSGFSTTTASTST